MQIIHSGASSCPATHFYKIRSWSWMAANAQIQESCISARLVMASWHEFD